MKELTKVHFTGVYSILRILATLFTIHLLITGGLEISSGLYISGFISVMAGLVALPYILVSWGLIKYLGMTAKMVNLAQYEFDKDLVYEDYGVTVERAKELDNMLDIELKRLAKKGRPFGPTSASRDLAVKNNLNPTEYLFLLARANIVLGEQTKRNLLATGNDNSLSEKIKKLKEKLSKVDKKNKDKRDRSEPPKEDGKYDFL